MIELFSGLDVVVQIHIAAALLSVALAPLQLLRRPKDRVHKTLGYVWVLAMAATALSSFWIHGFQLIGPFSPIHGLSAFVLFSLTRSILAARAGAIKVHEQIMRSLAMWALGVAGLFTLLPGRTLNIALFGDWGVQGFAATFAIGATALLWPSLQRLKTGWRDA